MRAPVALTIGNFDGVHLGHAALIQAARSAAGPRGRVVAVTFEPHPLALLRPDRAPRRLTSSARRRQLLLAAGADQVETLEVTRELLALEPQHFVAQLAGNHQPTVIVAGPDFRFGRDRAGGLDTLRQLEAQFGYRTIEVEPVEVRLVDQTIQTAGSTLARALVATGRMRDAAAVLGRAHELCGTVVAGAKRGRDLGMPTANLEIGDQLLPADGVYAGAAWCPDGARHVAAISVGTNPTFAGESRRCEAHLVGWSGPLDDYGWPMRLEIAAWLRDQIRYEDVAMLTAQMRRDVERVSSVLAVG